MKILDLSAGRRAIWFNKKHPSAVFIDQKIEVFPDIIADSTKLPFEVGFEYDLVVFDPPHVNCGKNSNMSRVYGCSAILKRTASDPKLIGVCSEG